MLIGTAEILNAASMVVTYSSPLYMYVPMWSPLPSPCSRKKFASWVARWSSSL